MGCVKSNFAIPGEEKGNWVWLAFIFLFDVPSEDLGESAPTVRRWKAQLINARVILNRPTKHGIILSLLPPYDSPATALKDDVIELKLRSDPKTRNMLKMALGSNYMVLLPIIADLAQRVERLEGNPKTPSNGISF